MLLEDQSFDIFVASKIGSFKHVKYHTDSSKNSKKCIENLVEIKSLQKDDTITCMAWGDKEQTEIILGKKNQQVQTYNTTQASFTKTVTADYGTGEVVGVAKYKRRLITALSSGVVKIWSKKEEVLVNTGAELDRLRSCGDDETLFATGGQENELKVYRIGELEPTFVAKNLPQDWLQLRQPVWVSDLCFLPAEGGRLLAVCSRYGYVRLYDTRAQRRPVCNVVFQKMAATCITASFDEKQVLVGFGRGQLHQVDLRAQGRPDKGYKGCAGAVTAIDCTQGRRQVVAVSLDRHLRVWDHGSKTLLYKQYLTSKLTSVLVQNASSTPLARGDTSEVKDEVEVKDEDDLDALFESMERVSEKPKKKKHAVQESIPQDSAKKIKPSTEGSTEVEIVDSEEEQVDTEDAIKQLLKSTEKKKKRMEKKKKEKRAKSVFYNA